MPQCVDYDLFIEYLDFYKVFYWNQKAFQMNILLQ